MKAEDATSILRTGKAEHHPMPMEKIPLTQEVLNRQRQILIHGLRQFKYAKFLSAHVYMCYLAAVAHGCVTWGRTCSKRLRPPQT